MLKFDQLPPTVEGTTVDPERMRSLAYGIEYRCINNVAEACASIVLANSVDPEVIKGIGEKIGEALNSTNETQSHKDDGDSFLSRYNLIVTTYAEEPLKSEYESIANVVRW